MSDLLEQPAVTNLLTRLRIGNSVVAAIRTGVAGLVGLIISLLLAQGFDLPEEFGVQLTFVLTGLAIGGYNLLVIQLEQRIHPLFGLLLGIPRTPQYGNPEKRAKHRPKHRKDRRDR